MIRLVEKAKFVNHIVPASRSAGTVDGSAIDTNGFDAVTFQIVCGDIGAGGTVDAKIQESADGSTNWADITGAAITQLGATDDNKLPTIDVAVGGRANRKRYLRAEVVTAIATVAFGVVAALYEPEAVPQTQTVAAVVV